VYLSLPSNLMDRPNHLMSLYILSCFPCHIFYTLFITNYITWCIYNLKETNKTHIFQSFNHHIHSTELHTHFDVAILILRLCEFTQRNVDFLSSQNRCWVVPVEEIVKFNGSLSQFPVNRAFSIIQCWISQLLLY
jgi:magnesium-transporting ATPase (P-type)